MNTLATIAGTALLGGAAATSAAAVFAEAGLRPQSQIFGRTLIAGTDPAEVALTFDDGPNDRETSELLDLFAEHQVHATFFMIGRFVRERPELTRRVHAAGHVIGNHTVTHPWLVWERASRVREELRTCSAILEDTLGAPVRFFRPPHGARRPVVLQTARELGMTTVQWNVMGEDGLPIGADGILSNIRRDMAQAQTKGLAANILLHDGGDKALGTDRAATVSAVRTLLEQLPAEGKRFVGVDAWV